MIPSLDVNPPHYTFKSFAQIAITPDFSFYVDNKIYKCQTILICSISKIINQQLSSSNPIFEYNFKGIKDPNNIFEVFISLLNGNQHEINQSNAVFLNYIAKQLGIEALISATRSFVDVKITTSNVFSVFKNYGDSNIPCPEIIKFIQLNWKTLKNDSSLSQLTLNSLKFLFSFLTIKSNETNWYSNFVSNLINQRGKEFSILYNYIDLSFASNSLVSKVINKIAVDSVPEEFINSIESRFIKEVIPTEYYSDEEETVEPEKEEPAKHNLASDLKSGQLSSSEDKNQGDIIIDDQEAVYQKGSYGSYNSNFNNYAYDRYEEDYLPEEDNDDSFYNQPPQKLLYKDKSDTFKGVFNYIMTQKPNSFCDIVEVNCGGDSESIVYNLFEYDNIWSFNWNTYSRKEKSVLRNAWITIKFPFHKLCLSNYTLASSRKVNNKILEGLQPKSWKIEGSDDMENWTLLSSVKETNLLKDIEAVATFKVNANQQIKKQNYFSCFKLTLIENGARSTKPFSNQLKLNAIEFYGVLMTKASIQQFQADL